MVNLAGVVFSESANAENLYMRGGGVAMPPMDTISALFRHA